LKSQFFEALGLGPGHPWMLAAHRLRRTLFRIDGNLSKEYLAIAKVPKLHIGGGARCLDGWLNTDVALLPGVVQMDATQPFPFGEAVFDYVFTEHMIEHVSLEDAMFMLRECHRVMKTGAVIRVTTPNLASIVKLYSKDLPQLQRSYLDWFCNAHLGPDCPATPARAINAMFRLWGHQFIYDEQTLADLFRKVGFGEISRHALLQSEHRELQNLENVERYPEGLLEFESLALEARK
jgi:predicted SAM-dependent methyltransferase